MTPGEILFQIGREKGRISASDLADELCRRCKGATRDSALSLITYHASKGNLLKVGEAKPGKYRGRPCNVYRVNAGAKVKSNAPPIRRAQEVRQPAYSGAGFSIIFSWHEARR